MVDIEKIKERKNKKENKDKSKKKKKKKDDQRTKSRRTQAEPHPAKSNDDGDIKSLLFVIGNFHLYPRTMSGYAKKGMEGKSKKILESVASDITSETIDFMGVFGVEHICRKYDYEFDEIVDHIASGDKYGKMFDAKESRGKRSDVKDLLDCIANCLLYVEGVRRKPSGEDDPNFRVKKSAEVAEVMHEEFKDVISALNVQKIAEKNGYSWKDDIIKGVLEDQSYDDIIERKWK